MKFSELFGNAFVSAWPTKQINTEWALSAGDIAALRSQIDQGFIIEDVDTDVGADGTLVMTGKLKTDPSLGSAAETILYSGLFPSMRFVVSNSPWSSDFRVMLKTSGAFDVQIDKLPLKVMVPADLLAAHPDGKSVKQPDITLADDAGHSIIEREFALTLEEEGHLRLEPHLPISIGPCRFSGIPMRAIHDLTLIGAPERAYDLYGWIVRDLNTDLFPADCGGLGFGGLEIDWDAKKNPLANLRKKMRIDENAEVVIEDLVIPTHFNPPLPQHGTFGIRRTLEPGESLTDQMIFTDAAIQIPLGDSATLFFDQLYFQTPEQGASLSDGLSLEGGIAFNYGDNPASGWEIGLGIIDGDLLRASVKRPIPATVPPSGSDGLPIIHIDLWAAELDLFRLRAGVSLSEVQKEEPDAGSAVQVLGDIMIREKPDGDKKKGQPVAVKTEDGKPFAVALTDVGWDRGKISFEVSKIPDVVLTVGPFSLEIEEMGLVSEHGATYFSLSGGIRESSAPFEGRVWFKRLRGPLAGNPDAPKLKLDGFGAEFSIKDVIYLSVHGYYRNEVVQGTRIKEHGLGGLLMFKTKAYAMSLELDLYWGERTPQNGPTTDYLLFQIGIGALSLPIPPVEISAVEALYARNLMPRLEAGDREAGELKYYSWLKKSRPTAVDKARDLSPWKHEVGSGAVGAGFGFSFTGCGEICLLQAFMLFFNSEKEDGLIIVVELMLFGGKKPIATGIFEYDFERDIFVLQIKIDLSLSDIIDNFPKALDLRLGGTITFGNQPGLVAFGRINDQDTWIGAKLDIKVSDVVEMKVRLALCFEWLEDEYVSVGYIYSLKVNGDIGVVQLSGWGSILAILRWMESGTGDNIARMKVELGFSLVIFGFLRFGLSASMLAEVLGQSPYHFVFRVTLRIETPWFLPDVSVSFEVVKGELEPEERGVLSSPLLDAGCVLRQLDAGRTSRQANFSTSIQRLDKLEGGARAKIFRLTELPAAANTWSGESQPIPLDSEVHVRFSPIVADSLGIASSQSADVGRQSTGTDEGELIAQYTLKRLTLERRPLSGGAWENAEMFAAAGDARHFRWTWDADTRTGGETAQKKLILNGMTPFTLGPANPIADAEILAENPTFPCCQIQPADVARLDFCDTKIGFAHGPLMRALDWIRRDRPSPIVLRAAAHTVHSPQHPGAGCDRVAGFPLDTGRILWLSAQEDIAETALNLTVEGRLLRLVIVARDAKGTPVFVRDDALTGGGGYRVINVAPGNGYRSLEVFLSRGKTGDNDDQELLHHSLELDWIECVTVADRAREAADRARCERIDESGHEEKATFLPRHEYRLSIDTQIGVKHTTTEESLRTVTERVKFITAGPPGLNEAPSPGLELEPYVVSARAGGRGLLYREESVHLVLASDLKVFGPGTPGIDESSYRFPVTLSVESAFDTNPENAPKAASYEGSEWFLTRRGSAALRISAVLKDPVSALTTDPMRLRYKDLTEASPAACPPDDVWNVKHPRLGLAPFDPEGRALWKSSATYHAAMRPAGAPVVNRASFEAGDLSAFLSKTGVWSLLDGHLRATGVATAQFGAATWDHFQIEVVGDLDATSSLSARVLIEASGSAVRFVVTRSASGTGQIRAEDNTGGLLDAATISSLPKTVNLKVDVFADALRCTAGEAEISVPRGARGPGLCEIGGRDVTIRSLRVRGLEMYGFDFTTSRYESFAAHVSSATGAMALPISAGAEALSALIMRLGGQIDVAMNSTAIDSERERVFDEAARALAVPLREDPRRLHLDVARNGSDRWLLLETPEPMDFTEEITARLMRRVVTPPPVTPDLGRRLKGILADVFVDPAASGLPQAGDRPVRDPVRLGPLARRLESTRRSLAFAPNALGPAAVSVRLDAGALKVTNERTGKTTTRSEPALSSQDRALLKGMILRFDTVGRLVDWLREGQVSWEDVPVRIIQNGLATKALVLPKTSGTLATGTWRLDLKIVRRWFDTTDPLGNENAYLADAKLPFQVM